MNAPTADGWQVVRCDEFGGAESRPPTGTGAVRGIPPPVCGQLFYNTSASITRMPLGPRT
jgi:hypothetical protein